jgi:hypothetical protein
MGSLKGDYEKEEDCMINFLCLLVACLALAIAALALHRNAVLSNEVGKCKMVEIGLQKRLDRLEGGE